MTIMRQRNGGKHRVFSALGATLFLLGTAEALGATFRYSSSNNRIYVENGGTATLSQIKAALPSAPLDLVNSTGKVWLLRANLYVEDGSTLVLKGASAGGDVNELRLKSDSGSTGFIQVTADYGNFHIEATKITSWNTSANGPDTEYSTGRAFMRVRSKLSGSIALESRMDIVNSEIAYLGYNASESYGLVWKVTGSGTGLYDKVQVRGNIIGSHIHHNYFGVYTYGHQDGLWRDNEVNNNIQYGFDPHDDSDDLIIENNEVHHNGNHGIIASKRCDHVIIRNNRSYSNTGNGIMLHRSSDDGLVEDNETFDNSDSGVAIFASARTVIRNNIVRGNRNSGMRFSVGSADSLVENNQISGSGKYGLYFYKGSDTPEPGSDGRPKNNVFNGNTVENSASEGVKMADSDNNRFIGNTFAANGSILRFERSSNTEFSGNTLPTGVTVKVAGSSELASQISFSSQPQVKLELDSFSTARFDDDDNAIFDPDEAIFTVAGTTASSLALTSAQISSTTTVFTRKLFATPNTGTVSVNPTLWNTASDRSKTWNARAASSSASVLYRVGDLVSGSRYTVDRGSTRLGTFTASGGQITFTNAPGTTAQLTYSVRAAP